MIYQRLLEDARGPLAATTSGENESATPATSRRRLSIVAAAAAADDDDDDDDDDDGDHQVSNAAATCAPLVYHCFLRRIAPLSLLRVLPVSTENAL